ncbi:hypothetical protein K438DRAFT_1813289 [Mycena galopus ATCC 62051]|nr:hypothetical protein K438DRAFT_1813289 [Mycena galopus ATCC 62051]
MFATSLVLWTLDMANFIIEVKLSFIEDPELALDARFGNALSSISPRLAATDALYAYMSLLGDAIIIWRVWNLKSYYRPWVILIPVSLLAGSLVGALMLTYCTAMVGSAIVAGTFERPAFCRHVQTISYAMACATTTTATILIGFTTWHFRKAIKPMLSGHSGANTETMRRRRSPVENILLLLLESGILYFLFFAVQIVAIIPRVFDWIQSQPGVVFAFEMYSYSSSVIVGIYPTAVVVLAHLQTSVLDDAAASRVNSTLRMAPPTTTTDGSWPTLQFGTKRTENEIELEPGLNSSSHDLEESQNRAAEKHV